MMYEHLLGILILMCGFSEDYHIETETVFTMLLDKCLFLQFFN